MTRKYRLPTATPEVLAARERQGRWSLQDAKSRFSEVVRLAHSSGPQHVTLHGRDAVVVVDAAEFQRLCGGCSGQQLVDALAASPQRDVDLAPARGPMPVRDLVL